MFILLTAVVDAPTGHVTLGAFMANGIEQKGIDTLQQCIKKCASAGLGIPAVVCIAIDFVQPVIPLRNLTSCIAKPTAKLLRYVLAESAGDDLVQDCCSCVQVYARDSSVVRRISRDSRR